MTQPRKVRSTARRIFRKLVVFLLVLIVFSSLYVSVVGFPDWLVRKLVARMSEGNFLLKVESMRLDILHGLVLKDTEVYRKGVVGPCAVNAKEVLLIADPLAVIRRKPGLKGIRISRGVIRPVMMTRGDGPQAGGTVEAGMQVRLELEECEVQGVMVKSMTCDVRADRGSLYCANILGTLNNGDLNGGVQGDVTYDTVSRIMDGRVTAQLDPHLVIPVLEAWDMLFAVELVQRFKFGEKAPRFEMAFSRLCSREPWFNLDGRFWLEDSAYRDVPLLRTDGRMRFSFSQTNAVVSVDPLLVVREEGIANGALLVDLRKKVVEFHGVSALQPKALAHMVEPSLDAVLEPLRFDGPTRIMARGWVGYSGDNSREIEVDVRGREVAMLGFVADECSFDMKICGLTNRLSDIRGTMYGGTFNGSVEFVLPEGSRTNTGYHVEGEIENIALRRIIEALTSKTDVEYRSKVSGVVELRGLAGEGNAVTALGEGYITMKEGRILALPLFGGLTDVMTKVIPGLDFVLKQTDARADFVINNGRAKSEEILIEGDVLSLNARGNYYFNKDLDFKVQIRLMKKKTFLGKIVQLVIRPVSSFFEFRLAGTLDEPKWYPRNFSRDLLKKLGLSKEDGTGRK